LIKASHINNLLEEYHDSFQQFGKYVEVFKNPSKKELKDLGQEIRFIADAVAKTIYVWEAILATHNDVYREISDDFSKGGVTIHLDGEEEPLRSCLIEGIAKWRGQGYEMFESHGLDNISTSERKAKKFFEDLLSYEWSWADHFVKITHYLEKFEEVLNYIKEKGD